MKVTYDSNNSGGHWWLKDDDWKALEKAGWVVHWKPERWLGALATSAEIECETPQEAIRSFEAATGQNAADEGCNCCGAPHAFHWDDYRGHVSGEECAATLLGLDELPTYRELLNDKFGGKR